MGGTSDALAPRHDPALQGHLMLPITPKWTHLEKVSEDIIKLAGGNPDEFRWLVENLAGLADALLLKKQIEDERPKKAELRKKLNNLHSAARLIEGFPQTQAPTKSQSRLYCFGAGADLPREAAPDAAVRFIGVLDPPIRACGRRSHGDDFAKGWSYSRQTASIKPSRFHGVVCFDHLRGLAHLPGRLSGREKSESSAGGGLTLGHSAWNPL